jgi:WD40 repeat protein
MPAGVGLGFSPNGTTFAGASGDGTVQFFDPSSGRLQRTLTGITAKALAFSPDGKRILVLDPNQHVQVVSVD